MRRVFYVFAVVMLILNVEAQSFKCRGAESTVLKVPDDFSTIQDAINNAVEGDTVFVRAGTYYEHVTVSKSITLLGEDKDVTIIDGNLIGNVVRVTQDHVNIRGFTIQRSGRDYTNSGIYVGSTRYCDISANYIVDNEYGVHGSPSNMSVTDNTIEGNFLGVDLQSGATNNVISGNRLVANYVGVHLNQADTNYILQNNMINNQRTVTLWESENNKVYHNNFLNDTFGSVTAADPNFLDNGLEGNYWSNYTGVDLNHDGIGDSPCVIDANHTDHYPLMSMFCSYNTSYGHAVDFVSNSSILNASFDPSLVGVYPPEAILTFNISGETGTGGFLRVCIPKILINDSYVVRFNDEVITNTTYPRVRELPCSNETYTYFYINYTHSEHTITITGTSACAHRFAVVPDDYATIQEAINNAIDGDTIYVKSGVYYEHVVVNKTVLLIGEDRDTTIIDGNETGPVVLMGGNGANLTRFTIRAGQNTHPICDVWLENTSQCNVCENRLADSFYGVYLNGSDGNSICANYATNLSIGICGFESDGNLFVGNELGANSFAGVNLHLCSFNNLTQNLIDDSSVGIRLLDGANNNNVYHNNFIGNTIQTYIQSSYNNTWDDGYPSGGNYWSNYASFDGRSGPYQNETGSDGIGDTPLILAKDNLDRYPLMKPWTEEQGLIGDVNADGKVDMKDVGYVSRRFMCVPGDPLWDVNADFNTDGKINMVDIGTVARHFGESLP